MLRKFHPLFISIHSNHPRELTTEVRDALGRLPRDLFPPTVTRITEDVASRVFAGESIVSEDVFATPSGKRYFLTARFPLRGGSRRVEAMGGIGIETTERRRMADELVASEELAKAAAYAVFPSAGRAGAILGADTATARKPTRAVSRARRLLGHPHG